MSSVEPSAGRGARSADAEVPPARRRRLRPRSIRQPLPLSQLHVSRPRSGYELEVHRISETIRQLPPGADECRCASGLRRRASAFQTSAIPMILPVGEAKSETLVQPRQVIGNSIAALGHEQAQIAPSRHNRERCLMLE